MADAEKTSGALRESKRLLTLNRIAETGLRLFAERGYEATTLDAIAAAVIGGTSLSAGGIGTVAGTIVGALIIGVLNNTLDLMNVSAFWQQIVKGCIIVGAVIIDQLKNRGRK